MTLFDIRQATEQVLAEPDGPWERVVRTKKELVKLIRRNLYSPEYLAFEQAYKQARREGTEPLAFDTTKSEYRTASPFPALDQLEAENFLIGHYGIKGVWGNGPERVMQAWMKENVFNLSLEQNAQALVESFAVPSELMGGTENKPNEIASKMGITQETAADAISKRIPQAIEQWLEVNQALIPQQDQTAIRAALETYRSGVEQVIDYTVLVQAAVIDEVGYVSSTGKVVER